MGDPHTQHGGRWDRWPVCLRRVPAVADRRTGIVGCHPSPVWVAGGCATSSRGVPRLFLGNSASMCFAAPPAAVCLVGPMLSSVWEQGR